MLSNFVTDLLYNSAGVLGAEIVGIYGLIKPNDSTLVRYAKQGLILSAIDEILNYVRLGHTWISNGDIYLSLDNAVFNTATWAVLDQTNLSQSAWSMIEKLGLPSNVSSSIGTGLIKISIKQLQDVVNSYGSESQLMYLTHFVSKLKQMSA